MLIKNNSVNTKLLLAATCIKWSLDFNGQYSVIRNIHFDCNIDLLPAFKGQSYFFPWLAASEYILV